MYRWVASLANWCLYPVSGGFRELDQQIMKFRLLKETFVRDRSLYCPDLNSQIPKSQHGKESYTPLSYNRQIPQI